jgi:hypothetical protein
VQHLLAGEGACCLNLFLPHLGDLHVDKVEDAGNAVLIMARARAAEAACHRGPAARRGIPAEVNAALTPSVTAVLARSSPAFIAWAAAARAPHRR